MFLSLCLLSAALTKISSKILYKPGTKVTSLQFIPTSSSYTHINWVNGSTDPMYVSGRRRICSSWVFFWYTLSTDNFFEESFLFEVSNSSFFAELFTQVSAPSAPARLDLAMAAPPAQARGGGLLLALRGRRAAGPAARTDRCAPRSLAAPHRGPEPPRRPRRQPPSNSSAAPGPSARPRVRKGWRCGAASRGPRGRWG